MNSTADVWGSREGVPSPPPHGDLPRQKAGGSSIMHQLLKISHALSLALSPSAYLSLSSPLFGSLSVSLSVFLFLYLLSIYHKSIIGSPAHCWGWVARRCPPPKKKNLGVGWGVKNRVLLHLGVPGCRSWGTKPGVWVVWLTSVQGKHQNTFCACSPVCHRNRCNGQTQCRTHTFASREQWCPLQPRLHTHARPFAHLVYLTLPYPSKNKDPF